MGSFDGAECCEIVGLFMLNKLSPLNCGAGLYRDDGLAYTSSPPRLIERTKKEIVRLYQEEGLRITISANLKIVNMLDVKLDLNSRTYGPYMKDNNVPLYVNNHSNHPLLSLRISPIM